MSWTSLALDKKYILFILETGAPLTIKTTDADAPPASIKEATMKKTMLVLAKALVIAAVFFTTACSTNTPPAAPEGATSQEETIGHADMSPSEMLDACISVGKDMSLSEKMDMIEKLPPNGEVLREIEFLKTAYFYTRSSILSDSRMAHGQMRDALGVSELPPNIESFISALYDRASKEGKDSLPGINDILPGIIEKGYFLP